MWRPAVSGGGKWYDTLNKNYAPNAFTRIGADGSVLTADAKPEAAAEYLANLQWGESDEEAQEDEPDVGGPDMHPNPLSNASNESSNGNNRVDVGIRERPGGPERR